MKDSNLSLNFWWNNFDIEFLESRNLVVEKMSRFTWVIWIISQKSDIKAFLSKLKEDKYYRKATHNSYAFCFEERPWFLVYWSNDDWETWAWKCILREIQRENLVWVIIVVTRYFWWIYLWNNRFKCIIETSQKIIKESKK